MKTSELTGPALDWAVAKCEGVPVDHPDYSWQIGKFAHQYSTDWSQGGPIIEREEMSLVPFDAHSTKWEARCKSTLPKTVKFVERRGPTPLIAAMRCYVASKLGDTVDIPDELL